MIERECIRLLYLWLMAKLKRSTDINQRAKSIVDIAKGEVTETLEQVDELKAAAAA